MTMVVKGYSSGGRIYVIRSDDRSITDIIQNASSGRQCEPALKRLGIEPKLLSNFFTTRLTFKSFSPI